MVNTGVPHTLLLNSILLSFGKESCFVCVCGLGNGNLVFTKYKKAERSTETGLYHFFEEFSNLKISKMINAAASRQPCDSELVFVTGRGGAGSHSPDPALTRGRGGYVSANPHPATIRGPPALIPWMGPRLLPRIFNGDPSGVWVGRGPEGGQGQGMPKKTPRPRPLSGAGRGKGPGACVFRGPVRPVTNSTLSQKPKILLEWPLVLLPVIPQLLVNPPVVRVVLVPKVQPKWPQPHIHLWLVQYLLRPPTNTFKVPRSGFLPTID